MKALRKIRHDLQSQIDDVIKELLDNCTADYIKKVDTSIIKGYIADIRRGHAYADGHQFTVPLWAYDRRHKHTYHGAEGYFKYYVAHELAHQLRYLVFDVKGGHDFFFYRAFKAICPKELQHFELNYIKRADTYGITYN